MGLLPQVREQAYRIPELQARAGLVVEKEVVVVKKEDKNNG